MSATHIRLEPNPWVNPAINDCRDERSKVTPLCPTMKKHQSKPIQVPSSTRSLLLRFYRVIRHFFVLF
jgi:hypothetical protein